MKSILEILASKANSLNQYSSIYGISIGHYNNGRETGYIDLDFDTSGEKELSIKLRTLNRVLEMPYGVRKWRLDDRLYVTARFFLDEPKVEDL